MWVRIKLSFVTHVYKINSIKALVCRTYHVCCSLIWKLLEWKPILVIWAPTLCMLFLDSTVERFSNYQFIQRLQALNTHRQIINYFIVNIFLCYYSSLGSLMHMPLDLIFILKKDFPVFCVKMSYIYIFV